MSKTTAEMITEVQRAVVSDPFGPRVCVRTDTAIALLADAEALAALEEQAATWQPIATAPKDGNRPLYLARLSEAGAVDKIDFNGAWESDRESPENPEVYWFWGSASGIEDPTHWAYQDGPPPSERAEHEAKIQKLRASLLRLGSEECWCSYDVSDSPEHEKTCVFVQDAVLASAGKTPILDEVRKNLLEARSHYSGIDCVPGAAECVHLDEALRLLGGK
jgi:hypothetical protein